MGPERPGETKYSFPRADCLPLELRAWECHVHTHYTDGQMSVREAVDQALAIGLSRLIFTEHTEPWRARSKEWFPEYVAAIKTERVRVGNQLEIIIGVEAAALDFGEGLELTPEMEEQAEYILGAAHRYPGMEGRVRDLAHEHAVDMEFRTLMALARNSRVDTIAHIGGTCEKYCGPFPADLAEEVIREAALHGVTIDLNSSYHRPVSRYLELCKKHGARIAIGSDAHHPEEIGRGHRLLKEENEAQ